MTSNRARSGLLSLVAGAALMASPVAATTEWVGGGYVSEFVGCAGFEQVETVLTRLLPAGQPGNDPEVTTLLIQFYGRTHVYAIDTLSTVDTPVGLTRIVTGVEVVSTPQVTMRALTWSDPQTVLATGRGYVALEIGNFDGQSGCTARAVSMFDQL
ncbi:MAG: hypothetical protein KDK12_09420 [Rhodobacteraceae bacterium]|nr:hypothetical protein [Paracoccaceae bacterium]